MKWLRAAMIAGVGVGCGLAGNTSEAAALGAFEGQGDVGAVKIAGSASWDEGRQEYRVLASGANVWGTNDAFHFAWRKTSGDLRLTASIGWVGTGRNAHRKAGWMVRQSLAPDAPYADVAVHGDGLISLQYRRVTGGPTSEAQAWAKGAARVRLERDGDVFTLSVGGEGRLQPAASLSVSLAGPVYAGLFVCSHEEEVAETAIFRGVVLENKVGKPGQQRVRESTLEVISIESGERQLVYRSRQHFEAPNWSPDGERFVYNQAGRLYALPARGGEPVVLESGECNRCNNDHGFSADGKWLALSHSENGRSLVYVMPAAGGVPRRVTPLGPSYWHGWSPDGGALVYCAERSGNFDVYAIPTAGGPEKRLTSAAGLDDGPEYAPDGNWIYFNSERSGLMKIWRMKPDGSGQEQVTRDSQYADWFAHPSPDGKWLVFLSYDGSVQGHPDGKDVVLRIMPGAGGNARVLTTVFGGQGTINVPSWSPDSRQVAFVSYRFVLP